MLRVALRRNDYVIRIFRIDDHLIDFGSLLEPDVRPCLAGIGRFIYPIAG